jgi:hypothetical protein
MLCIFTYIVRLVVEQRDNGPCDVTCLDDLSCLLAASPSVSVRLLMARNVTEIPPTLHLQTANRLM